MSRERGILFSGAMVRALLDGRKTQTRRIVKGDWSGTEGAKWLTRDGGVSYAPCRDELCRGTLDQIGDEARCPYGVPGDRLWVRETHLRSGEDVLYADDADYDICYPTKGGAMNLWRVVAAIHMPRAYSRLTLELTAVRVERVQDISEDDCKAEGVWHDGTWWRGGTHAVKGSDQCWANPREAYTAIWRDVNGIDSWTANPWVWVLEFRRASPRSAEP